MAGMEVAHAAFVVFVLLLWCLFFGWFLRAAQVSKSELVRFRVRDLLIAMTILGGMLGLIYYASAH